MEHQIKFSLAEFADQLEQDISMNILSEHELLNKWTNKFVTLSGEYRNGFNKVSYQDLLDDTIKQIVEPIETKNLFSCVPTGLVALDRLITGLPLGELIILGARPAMGKTAFLTSIIANSVRNQNSAIAYFSLENSAQQVLLRIISNLTEFKLHNLVSKQLEEYQIKEVNEKSVVLKTANLSIEANCFYIDDIIAQTDYLVREKGIKLVIIDYLQLIRTRNKRDLREMEISRICRELKGIARKYNVAVLVSSQLSRAVENRGGDKRPVLSDLRESGAIEQDADKVMFLHRPEYYNITEDGEGNSTIGIAEIFIAKNRGGVVDSAKVRFIGAFASFVDLEDFNDIINNAEDKFFTEIRKNEFGNGPFSVVKGLKQNDIEDDSPF